MNNKWFFNFRGLLSSSSFGPVGGNFMFYWDLFFLFYYVIDFFYIIIVIVSWRWK